MSIFPERMRKPWQCRLETHRQEVHDRIALEHPELAERFKERRHLLDDHLVKKDDRKYMKWSFGCARRKNRKKR